MGAKRVLLIIKERFVLVLQLSSAQRRMLRSGIVRHAGCDGMTISCLKIIMRGMITGHRFSVRGGGGDSYVQKSYERYGDRILECMNYIGTECIYGKRVLDFGCAEGMLLDAVKGIAGETIGVELNREMLGSLRKRGHYAYETLEECLEQEAGSVDAAVSFDVIEHVMDPQKVLRQLYELLDEGGRIIMGTPTDSPVLRELAGKNFEEFLFHMGHLWTFSEDSLRMCFERAGFKEIEIKNIYKYSLGNVFGWLQKKRPVGNKKYDFVTDTLNEVWKHEMERQGKGDYLVAYARK